MTHQKNGDSDERRFRRGAKRRVPCASPGEGRHQGWHHFAKRSPGAERPPVLVVCEMMAGGPGFEPGLTDSKSAVLPLDDPPTVGTILIQSPDRAQTVALQSRHEGGNASRSPLRSIF